jgi:ubiquinone/menaquinone biosynthesis C-methylase UbiE
LKNNDFENPNFAIILERCLTAQNKAFNAFNFSFMSNILSAPTIKKCLDIGTGDGSFVHDLAEYFSNDISFDAVDLNTFLIEKAKKEHQRNNINYDCCFFDANYPNSNYDVIFTRFVLEHDSNVDNFLHAVYQKLKTNGCFVIIEYYIDKMHSQDNIWREFRDKEMELYNDVKSNPYVTIDLPLRLHKAGFSSIKSLFNQISPVTVGKDTFFDLIESYVHLYSFLNNEIWTEEFSKKILGWCEQSRIHYTTDPIILISHTIGLK